MRKIKTIHYILDDSLDDMAMGESLGELTLEYEKLINAGPFALFDCFDQSIRNSGKTLIFSQNRLTLLRQDGATLSQAAGDANVFVSELPDGRVKSALSFVSPLRRLLPVARGTSSLQQIRVVDDVQKTHVRVNLQTFRVKGIATRVTLATLQGLRGYDEAFELMRQQLETLGWKQEPDISSLYARLNPHYQPYNPKPDIAIAKEERAFQAASDIIKTYIGIARCNEPGILADIDTEFLHDYRVSLRKVRSVLSLFKGIYSDEQTQKLKQAFADLMSPTGRLRDLDVYLLDREHYFELLPASLHDGLGIMFDIFAAERKDELDKLCSYLKSRAYKTKINQLAKLFNEADSLPAGENADQPAHQYASMLIWKRYRKVCKIARAITPTTEDAEIHELRIQCKKLRYLMEFFSPMYPAKKIKGLIKALKVLQDNLGLFNDYSVQQESLQAFITSHASKGRKRDVVVAKSVGALIAMLYQKQLEERAMVISNFETFDSPKIQQQFREMFKNV
ncbi:MAG: CHAD domain-containing protein [Gammaproteobacteria bacterium]|nr:CHAD domain-containing protein [Gammaproteobacteria bacterium]